MPTPLRKKSNEARRRRSRTALLDAAQRVLVHKGYHSTLISDIVAEAGVGQGTFYRHFSSKREIFETLLERLIAALLSEFSDMSTHLPKDVEGYRQASISALGRMAVILERNREITLLFLREAPAIDRDFEAKISTFYQQFASLAQFYLDYAIAQGFARPCRSEIVAQCLVGIGIHLIEVWLRDENTDARRQELINEVVTFAFKGFGLYEA